MENTDKDSVVVEQLGSFEEGDTVMIYQPKGFEVDTDPADAGNFTGFIRHVGKYSILIIDSIFEHTPGVDTVIRFNAATAFDFTTKGNRHYFPGEVGQLIKVRSYKNAVVTGKLEAKPWDPVTNTGGVLALYVEGTLELQDTIDVSGMGFKGADPSGDSYGYVCYQNDPTGLDNYFYDKGATDRAGLKGEGAADTTFQQLRGKASLINGGGGGNGRYSGGAGGSNYQSGGRGGNESESCATPATSEVKGQPGYVFSSAPNWYQNDEWLDGDDDKYANRIFFGGGGGTGTQDGPGYLASAGGDGGGIVIIIADTLRGAAQYPILADGESVTEIATGAGGGGGAGGCIVLDVSHYDGIISASARGGDGGSTQNISNGHRTGPGGGGGGGFYWVKYDSTNLDTMAFPGMNGTTIGGDKYGSSSGLKPGLLTGLNVPLNGFLFNTLPSDRTVCSDETPDPINASRPKGGNGIYSYQWEYFTASTGTWQTDPSNTGEDYVFSGPLTETTKYRRVVTSLDLEETSNEITYFVVQKITGNTVIAPDTVCAGNAPVALEHHPDSTLGGAGIPGQLNYRWLQSTDNGTTWGSALGTNNQSGYAPPSLQETTLYSRLVTSGVCDDTSAAVTITVLDSVKNNHIILDTILCYNQTPDELTSSNGTRPDGGDPNDARYSWQVADLAGGPYSEVATTENYSPPALQSDKYYRRIFFSGSQDACIDTSNLLTVEVLPLIDQNNIITPDDTICEGDAFENMTGQAPSGGDGIYRYTWQSSIDSVTWSDEAFFDNINDPLTLASVDDTTYVRRIVYSGEDDVCQDTSQARTLTIVPAIQNNTLITGDLVYCQDIEVETLQGNETAGGDGTFEQRWEQSVESPGSWEEAEGEASNWNYEPGVLADTTYFRRIVWSDSTRGICRDTSAMIEVIVQPRIENNLVNWDEELPGQKLFDSICYNYDLVVPGTHPTSSNPLAGGDGNYDYTWEQSADGLSFANAAGTFDEPAYERPGFQDLTYFRRIVETGECVDTSDVVEMFVRSLPEGDLSLSSDNIICESDEVPVTLEVDLDGESDVTSYFIKVTYTSDEGTGTIDMENVTGNPGIVEHFPATADSADYVYVLESIVDNNGCAAPPGDLTGSATVRVYETPDAIVVQESQEVCGTLASLEAVPDQGGQGYWEQLAGTPEVAFSNPGSETSDALINPLQVDSETVEVGWILFTPRCRDTALASITYYREPAPPPYFDRDTVDIFFADSYELEAAAPTAGSGSWSVLEGPGSVSDEVNPQTSAGGLEMEAANTFRWTVENGVCESLSDEITIFRNDVTQYDGFSPNPGDDFNRYFVMKGASKADDFTFTVFNSWGTPIKTITKVDAEEMGTVNQGDAGEELILWDGTSPDNSTLVPDGTYYYHIKLMIGDEVYNKNGYIVLKTR